MIKKRLVRAIGTRGLGGLNLRGIIGNGGKWEEASVDSLGL